MSTSIAASAVLGLAGHLSSRCALLLQRVRNTVDGTTSTTDAVDIGDPDGE